MTKEALTLAIDVAINAMKDATKSIDKLSAENRTLKEALAQPQRTWVELTVEETETLIHRFDGDPHTLLDEVNARLKEKNGGT